MQEAIDQFRANISRVRNLGAIVDAVGSQTTDIVDLSDILRAELVMSVSALDHYVHEVVRLGMLESFRGTRLRTPQFFDFQVSLASALDGIAGGEAWLGNQIRIRNGYRSFQTPDNIASAIRLVSEVRLWDEVGSIMSMRAADIRERLSLIVDRRNMIAHEADMNPSPYEDRYPIDRVEVTDSVDFVEQVAHAIFAAL
jgi:hypothetical protein